MAAIEFFVEGIPVPKKRARVVRMANGKVRSYTPARTASWENRVRIVATAACGRNRWKPTTKRVELRCYFTGLHPRADVDNAVKSVADALNGVVYVDDRQAHAIVGARVNGVRNGVYVQVEELEKVT